MKKYILIASIGLLWMGCKTDSNTTETNPEENSRVERLSSPDELPEQFGLFYKGKIGASLEIAMRLERDGSKLSGIYWYTKNKVAIPIEGTFSKGEVVIKEYAKPNTLTGTFTGKYASGTQFAGKWTNPKGDLAMDFSLAETSDDGLEKPVEDGGTIKTIVLSKKTEHPKGDFEYAYPDFGSLGLAKIAAYYDKSGKNGQDEFFGGLEDDGDMGSDWQGSSSIHYRGNGLISVYGGASYYYAGAAHPNSHSFCELWSEATQKQIKLEELFIPKSSWKADIVKYCKADLKKQVEDEGFQADVDENVKEEDVPTYHFLVSDKGLEINFDTYSVSAYIYGSQSVLIPWNVLKGDILEGGPISAFKK